MAIFITAEFIALGREAGIAAELLASGATLLRKANAAQNGLYSQAFFNLSIGIERAAKLAIIIDYSLKNTGKFPSDAQLRNYGHDLLTLVAQVNSISTERRKDAEYSVLPSTNIHTAMLEVLSEFAKTTRYFNLDYLVGGKAAALKDPIASWFLRVGRPILEEHYSLRQASQAQADAEYLENAIGDLATIVQHNETAKEMKSVRDNVIRARQVQIIQKYGQFYMLQLIRFFAFLLSELSDLAHRTKPPLSIPEFLDFFGIFMNSDDYLKRRATWSIYRP